MKFILLAATAMIATPLMAQDMSTQTPPAAGQTTPAPADQTMPPPADQTTAPADPATTPTAPPPADPATTGGTMAPAQTTDTASAPMGSGDPSATDPAGGYQPSQPATTGTPAPGATVRFQPAADPNTAYPPPAPLQKYPVCKRGQYDNCMQRGGR